MNIPENRFDEMCLELLKRLYSDEEYEDVLKEYEEEAFPTPEMVEIEIVLGFYGIYRYVNYN